MSRRPGLVVFACLSALFLSAGAPSERVPAETEKGTCDWYCDTASYRTAAACDLACDTPCERICW